MARGQPGPRAQMARGGEPGDVADLGDEHRRPDRADPGDGLDRPIPVVGGQPGGDPPVRQPDLGVEGVDQAQVGDSPARGRRDPALLFASSARPRGRTGRSTGTCRPCLASTPCTPALNPERTTTSLARWRTNSRSSRTGRWGDPRLGQPAHPQQVRQVRGVAHVVLHPPIGESLDPQRVRQVHPGAGLGQHVRRPVPAVRCFEHDLRFGPALADLTGQRQRIVGDPHAAQLLACLGRGARSPSGAGADRSRRTVGRHTHSPGASLHEWICAARASPGTTRSGRPRSVITSMTGRESIPRGRSRG